MANGQGSAGVAIREYEVTGPVGTPPPLGIPAGVIGTALRGPAFVPVTVGSNAAFRLKFGGTDGKKFGPLAINEWMVNSGGRAATYLRVLGAGDCKQRNEDGTVTKAGFVVGSELPDESGDLARNPHATVTTVAATAASASIVVLSVPNPVGADDNEGFVFRNSLGNQATLIFDSTVAASPGFVTTQSGGLSPSTTDLLIRVGARADDTILDKAQRIEAAIVAAAAFGVTAAAPVAVTDTSSYKIVLRQTTTGILPPAYRPIEPRPVYGLPGSIEVTPFSAGTNISTTGENGPGRTYFLGGMMKDYVPTSPALGLNYLLDSGIGKPSLSWNFIGESDDPGVWCRKWNDTHLFVGAPSTTTYKIWTSTTKFLTGSAGIYSDYYLPGLKSNGDILLGWKFEIPVGNFNKESILKLDLGTSDTFTPGTINLTDPALSTAGLGSSSSGGALAVGNITIPFTPGRNHAVKIRRQESGGIFSTLELVPGATQLPLTDTSSPIQFSYDTTDDGKTTIYIWINKSQFFTWARALGTATPDIDAILTGFKDITNTVFVPQDEAGNLDETFIPVNTVNSYESSYPVVRGVLMAPSGVLLDLKKTDTPVPTFGDDAGLVDANQGFVLRLNGFSSGSASTFVSASFDPRSDSYFAKVLNTDPLKIQERGHYLYASWDVHPGLATVSGSCFILNGSEDYNTGSDTVPNFENWEDRFSHPVTPWVVSQKFGASPKNLFRLHSLDDGEGAATSYKFSIENLVPGNPEIAGGFGTFDLLIRDWNDTDADPVILESFRGLTLDPRSDKYVARAIGNSYRRFDFDRTESEQKLVDEIDHPMGSNLVRVEMDYSYEEGNIEPSALPMGFRGVNHLNTRGTLSGESELIPHISTPPVPMRFNLVVGAGTRSRLNSDLFWGMQFENISGSTEPNSPPAGDLYRNRSLEAFTKFFPSHLTEIAPVWKVWTKEGESDLDSFCNNGFSLEKIFVVENAGDTSTTHRADPSKWNLAKYARDGQQPTAPPGVDIFRELNVNDLTLPKNRRHAKFTFVMQGGFNGVNIFNADMSDMTNKAVTQEVDNQSRGRTDGPTVRAYLKSIDIMKNTVNSDLQLLAIPGIRNSSVTEVAADAVRDRFDALYLMDVEQKSTRLGEDELPQDVSEGDQDLDGGLRVSVAATVSHFEERDMDNSFAAAYFPDVVVTDPGTGGNVTVPPSVVVLGAMALNDRVGHPWFAPAGVTRGALASTQRAKVSLSKANLDALYNVGINPLTPPSAGLPVTVWGQKTLQAGNSALNRVNVRRLLIEIRRQVRDIAQTIIFEPNRAATLARFTAAVTPRLQRIQALSGLDRFRVVIDSSTTTQQDVENNTIRGKIFVQPTKSIEYVSLDFVVSNSGAQV